MQVRMADLIEALEFVGADEGFDNQALLDRRTGHVYWRSDLLDDELDPLPDDVDDADRYLAIPSRRDLGLDSRVALDFARELGPRPFDDVRDIFSRRGAYRRFKDYLGRRGLLDRWYAFSNAADEAALRDWCAEEDIQLAD